MSCDVGEVTERLEIRWRANCDVGEATEWLENELWRRRSDGKWRISRAPLENELDVGEATEGLENEL